MKKGEFLLNICNSFPESLFAKTYGMDMYSFIENNTPNFGFCPACGHEIRSNNSNDILQVHIFNVNKTDPAKTLSVRLCEACHMTQHIEKAVELKYIKFVNSVYPQEELVRIGRIGDYSKYYINHKILDLKKSPEQIWFELKSGTLKLSPTLKVVFTNNFVFNDVF